MQLNKKAEEDVGIMTNTMWIAVAIIVFILLMIIFTKYILPGALK